MRDALSLVAALLAAGCPSPARAQNGPPMFRQALDHWQPDYFEAVIFHRGELGADHQKLVARLEADQAERVNLRPTLVDLDAGTSPAMLELFEKNVPGREAPAVVVRFPASQKGRVLHVGALTTDTVQLVTQSPLRRDVAAQLLDGASAVWLLLESGDTAKDDAAADALRTGLQRADEELKLDIEAAKAAPDFRKDHGVPLVKRFTFVRVPRESSRERFFVSMMRSMEEDLKQYANEPIALPVFGRGRALYALTGEALSAAAVVEACREVLEPVRSPLKEDNIGTDLLMATAWEKDLLARKPAPPVPEPTATAKPTKPGPAAPTPAEPGKGTQAAKAPAIPEAQGGPPAPQPAPANQVKPENAGEGPAPAAQPTPEPLQRRVVVIESSQGARTLLHALPEPGGLLGPLTLVGALALAALCAVMLMAQHDTQHEAPHDVG
jgi:hypothetical protein